MTRFTVDNQNRIIFYDNPVVYDGQVGTNDPEEIYALCTTGQPEHYHGRAMAMSDVVELYDRTGSTFYYCDRVGFRAIDFGEGRDEG